MTTSKVKNFTNIFTTETGENYLKIFLLLCTLFLLWGFSMGLIDVLNKHFQEVLHISKAKSGFVQFAYYLGYFTMAIPAGFLAKKFGYKFGIICGLVLVALGSLWSIPATMIGTFFVFLIGLYVIASGLSFLETVANPYTTVLGSPEMGAARINMAQSCNAFGQLLGPLIGGQIILSATVGGQAASTSLYIPYIGIAVIVIVLAITFYVAKVPDVEALEQCVIEETTEKKCRPFWLRWHFIFAVVAQLFYMIAQTGIYSFFINYTVTNLRGCSDRTASVYLSLGGFGLFLLGRIIGSIILRKAKPDKTLAYYSLANVVLMIIVMLGLGGFGVLALALSFFFMSIMFPTIFALGIAGLGEQTKQASSFLVMAIVGGIFTPIMGYIADITNISFGFIVPLFCFLIVYTYAIVWKKMEITDAKRI
ncbi:MAG: L-fucose:H+ symporter permease [Gammaproteobacteria bacterium]|jgi:FHS family L-fucose permease-like MFS transporter